MIPISVKKFFIESRISITKRRLRSKPEMFDFQKKEVKKELLRRIASQPGNLASALARAISGLTRLIVEQIELWSIIFLPAGPLPQDLRLCQSRFSLSVEFRGL